MYAKILLAALAVTTAACSITIQEPSQQGEASTASSGSPATSSAPTTAPRTPSSTTAADEAPAPVASTASPIVATPALITTPTAPAPTTTVTTPAPTMPAPTTTAPTPPPLPPTGITCTVEKRDAACTLITTTETPRFGFCLVGADFMGGITTDSAGMSLLYAGATWGTAYFTTKDSSHASYTGYYDPAQPDHVDVQSSSLMHGTLTVDVDVTRGGAIVSGCDLPLIHVTCSGTVSL